MRRRARVLDERGRKIARRALPGRYWGALGGRSGVGSEGAYRFYAGSENRGRYLVIRTSDERAIGSISRCALGYVAYPIRRSHRGGMRPLGVYPSRPLAAVALDGSDRYYAVKPADRFAAGVEGASGY